LFGCVIPLGALGSKKPSTCYNASFGGIFEPMPESAAQKRLYEAIHTAYADHYYDREAMAYREEFIFRPMLRGVDLNDLRVAEFCCGAGHNTMFMSERFPRASFMGFDISAPACREYRANTGFPAYEIDLTKPLVTDHVFDVAFVVGGLHHCVSDLRQTLENVASMVRPGGLLLMMEPNRDYVLEGVRQFWYKRDRYFDAATEAALKHAVIANLAAPWFITERVQHLGGPGYFLIFNSMILRVPKRLKRAIAGPCFTVERAFNTIPWLKLMPYFVAQWRRI
jgi:SAM-dependent methyltransferase